MPELPRTNPDQVREQLESQILSLSRDPFKMALAHFLAAEPDIDSINEYSKKHPDRWARAITELTRASGYLDKRVEEHNFNFNFTNRGDGELIAELENMGVDVSKIIDGECDEITESEPTCLAAIPAETIPIDRPSDLPEPQAQPQTTENDSRHEAQQL